MAAKIGLEFLPFEVAAPDDYSATFAAMRAAGAQGVALMANAYLSGDRTRLAELAIEASRRVNYRSNSRRITS